MAEKVGIVICAWNCAEQVEKAARSAHSTCKDEGIPFGILIHDDCSELEPLQPHFQRWKIPGVEYLRQSRRLGLTHAWNRGIAWALESGCSQVALCNQDIEFPPGWLPRFVDGLGKVPALSPMSNSPGMHSDRKTLQGQDIRRILPEFKGKEVESSLATYALIMEKIKDNGLIQADGVKGFFLGFDLAWLESHKLRPGEYYSVGHAGANGGVGGSENEIFHRVGIRPWIAANIYIHHFRVSGNSSVGRAREIFLGRVRP